MGNGFSTKYLHNYRYSVKTGEKVSVGQEVSKSGNTGSWTTGPHLHFEVRINDRAVNPRPFLEAAPHVLEEARAANADQRS